MYCIYCMYDSSRVILYVIACLHVPIKVSHLLYRNSMRISYLYKYFNYFNVQLL